MFIDPYLANITVFAGNFAPRSWMFCQGQLLAIAQYDALYALIGTTYGGDGQTTFGLPDLRSRVAVHQGQGPGLSMYTMGEMSGTENVTLLSAQLPSHNHNYTSTTGNPPASTANGSISDPTNAVPASPAGSSNYNSTADGGVSLGTSNLTTITGVSGGSAPVPIISPRLALNYIIATEGIFPSRN
jgi:microcystin-dependent protein